MITVYVANKCPVIDFDPTHAWVGYETKNWNKAPNGEKLGDFETRPMAFQAMNEFAESVRYLIPKESCGLINTFTKERPDGLYVAYFDRGFDKNGWFGKLKKESCIEFVLIYSPGGGAQCL